ncbi:uncharacterized protein LOC144005155 [Festucalex cinctus]
MSCSLSTVGMETTTNKRPASSITQTPTQTPGKQEQRRVCSSLKKTGRKRRRLETVRSRQKPRIYIGQAFEQWRTLKAALGMKNDSQLALHLLRSYEKHTKGQCISTAHRPSTSTAKVFTHSPSSVSAGESDRCVFHIVGVRPKQQQPLLQKSMKPVERQEAILDEEKASSPDNTLRTAMYAEELCGTEEENERRRQPLDAARLRQQPRVVLYRADISEKYLCPEWQEPEYLGVKNEGDLEPIKVKEEELPKIKEDEQPQPPNIKEEQLPPDINEQENHVTGLPVMGVHLKTEDECQYEENKGAEPPSSSSRQQIKTEDDEDHRGGSQADSRNPHWREAFYLLSLWSKIFSGVEEGLPENSPPS